MSALTCLTTLAFLATPGAARPELSFDIWDWTDPCKDLAEFERWVQDLTELGFNRIEISVPWRVVEPQPGTYALSWVDDRLAICKKARVGMRMRINSYYAGATPDWYDGDFWVAAENEPPAQPIPSITDERFWARFSPLCTAIAEQCKGEDVYFSPFIGVHAELKWSEWWSYDPSTLDLWRETIALPRPEWLQAIVKDDIPLPEAPPVPQPTHGLPDTDPANRAWIAFRQQCWRDAVARFVRAIHQGDPDARCSAPLGESYRSGSAIMSNLDYWGLTRGMDQIVHSYDFFWHLHDPSWMAAASVAAFRGITSLPVVYEFDAYGSTFGWGYSYAQLMGLGRQARRMGAGLKVANYSYNDKLPSEFAFLHDVARLFLSDLPAAPIVPDHSSRRSETALLFVSKWANYCYREATEWLHEAQFGAYKLLTDLGIPVRVICEDNLSEDLTGYRLLYQSFSPAELMPEEAVERLEALDLPKIADVPTIPPLHREAEPLETKGLAEVAVTSPGCPAAPVDLSKLGAAYQYEMHCGGASLAAHKPGSVIIGYPIGFLYLHDAAGASAHQGIMTWAVVKACTPPDAS